VKKSVAPKWGQTFTFDNTDNVGFISVEVFDWDFLGSNDFLGRLSLDVQDIPEPSSLEDTEVEADSEAGLVDKWVPLEGVDGEGVPVTGEVRLRVRKFTKPLSDETPLPRDKVLSVGIVEAKELQAADWGGTSDPFVTLSFPGQKSIKSKVISKTLNPVWDEVLSLRIPADPEQDQDGGGGSEARFLAFDVFDHDLALVPLRAVMQTGSLDDWFPLQPRAEKKLTQKLFGGEDKASPLPF
ncbi:C2 domain-containing protein, partial [Baffinella frigidus]